VRMCIYVCVCFAVWSWRKGWIILHEGWLRTKERNYKRNVLKLNKGVEPPEGIRKSRDRDARWRPFSSGLRGPPRQDLSYTLLEGEDHWFEGNGWQWE